MKKLLIVVMVTLFSVSAMAQLTSGKSKGARAAGFEGQGYFVGDLVDNVDEAVRYTQDYIEAEFSGYTLSDEKPIPLAMHGGTSYYVYVTDSAGKDFTFLVGRMGYIFGPEEGIFEDPRY